MLILKHFFLFFHKFISPNLCLSNSVDYHYSFFITSLAFLFRFVIIFIYIITYYFYSSASLLLLLINQNLIYIIYTVLLYTFQIMLMLYRKLFRVIFFPRLLIYLSLERMLLLILCNNSLKLHTIFL